ncbi:LON peptidase substrate-binding domain-containing protein [Pseudoalteromonas tunicata]|jgi:Lon protease-like protein|uniref:Lon N-terminal domain-containing protein n=1 Tax=Pseudoalteromonas tunicata D2 TaxID=87626 RepID=A4C4A2_9GAMM|nr:LON peptidase substrate-binding domain-containing protein [Pseudoalteromonas tunicata]ATC97134.1 hypothetical protein PTUN_b0798 [Pseudoalteromonas tunicata]AXT33241.1 hypothetical protein D1819_20750 [Pseudoalteromonas tunicata]EAR30384.1 hypothetical protein PTD2_02406 [Pseudoalteromonas tunicata D2]MDP4984783.1 LON peptidase substrate-binding domain-containing protein [Pseudoalteromonas tunicata]
MQLGVFPLPIVLFPGGITRLRIFEPRYIRLVKESIAGTGFALSCYDKDHPFNSSTIAAWVEIVDFSTLDDGFLSIDIQAKSLVNLTEFSIESDQLRKAKATIIPHWPEQQNSQQSQLLAKELKLIFDVNPHFAAMYKQTDFDNPNWCCGRFVELLPIDISDKKQFLSEQSFGVCLNFLHTLICGEK